MFRELFNEFKKDGFLNSSLAVLFALLTPHFLIIGLWISILNLLAIGMDQFKYFLLYNLCLFPGPLDHTSPLYAWLLIRYPIKIDPK